MRVPMRAVAVTFGLAVASLPFHANAAPTAPASRPAAPSVESSPARVNATLRVLDKLHGYGYAVNTPARADRAIRHWQRANGLVVDGIVGPQTLGSLGLDKQGPTTLAPPRQGASEPAPQLDPPSLPAEVGDVESIIRDVWPDDLEDWAVKIATRESNLVPTAHNSICYGIFQIYYSVHRGWLAGFGITDPHQLFDARTNAEMAYQLYLIDGPGPWALG